MNFYTMENWIIRPARPSDQPEWLRMRLALWPDHSPEELQADLHEYFDEPGRVAAFMAETPGGALCAFLEASLRPYADGCSTSPVGYIEGWYVDEGYRLQGVGGALVAAAEAWAKALGCMEMASDCEIDNEISFRAHLALGYAEANRLICFHKPLR